MSQEKATPNNSPDEFRHLLEESRKYWESEDDFKVEVPNPRLVNPIDMEDYPDMPGKYGRPFPVTITKEWFPVGDKVYIHPTAQIGEDVQIGEGTYIGPFCVIGYPAEHKAFWDKPVGKVIIGKNCRITGHVTIDAGTEKATFLGDDVWMLKHSHVGHDATIHDNVTISCGAKIGGHATIFENTNIGLNACIHQWCNIPSGCMVGMGAVVTKTLLVMENRKYAGVPAKDIGPNIKK